MKPDKNYTAFVKQIKAEVLQARIQASRAVNTELVRLYWNVGQKIIENQEKFGWGEAVVEQLSKDLQYEFDGHTGFSARNLWLMRQFYIEYSDVKLLKQAASVLKLKQPVSEIRETLFLLPWGHHIVLMQKVKRIAERMYYIKNAAERGWSRNVLLNQVKVNAFERQLNDKKQHNFKLALPVHLAEQAEEALKSKYNLDFLNINKPILERQLENRIVEKIKHVILELGYGFCFIGNQYKLNLGKKDYYVDLLFYHRKLKCLVAIDLKIGEFEPEYAGKMNFYLNLLDEKERHSDENPSIGIILCADKNTIEVEFALKGIDKPIGVSAYQLTKKLPKQFKGELPNFQELEEIIKSELQH